MAKSRSPILGYNHNVRFRGLVFHVQTEDSGITNPHVFTHLFHGGVILSTRKLVYDAEASEETVKGLMQSQHKAVLRDLKRGSFDDKIDLYLGGTPGLLARGAVEDAAVAADVKDEISAPVSVPTPPATPPPLEPPLPEPARARAPTPMPTPGAIAIPAPGRTGRMSAITQDVAEARAPTERVAPTQLPPKQQAMTPPPVTTKPAQRGVSAAFDAIMVAEGAGSGGLAEVPGDEGAVEIRSEAPGSAPQPPGSAPQPPGAASERPGSYAQHRRRPDSIAPEPVAPPRPATPTGRTATPRAPTPSPGPLARPPTPMARPPVAKAVEPAPLPTYPSGRPTSPSPPPARPGAPRTRSPTTGSGGVVVTRPAVIIGAPARTVGTTPPPAAAAPPAAAPKGPPTGRVRKAREDSDSGLFGQDLISEKSLDEVILAYLSEDGSDD